MSRRMEFNDRVDIRHNSTWSEVHNHSPSCKNTRFCYRVLRQLYSQKHNITLIYSNFYSIVNSQPSNYKFPRTSQYGYNVQRETAILHFIPMHLRYSNVRCTSHCYTHHTSPTHPHKTMHQQLYDMIRHPHNNTHNLNFSLPIRLLHCSLSTEDWSSTMSDILQLIRDNSFDAIHVLLRGCNSTISNAKDENNVSVCRAELNP